MPDETDQKDTRRTAILLSGLPREVDECWRSFYVNLMTRMPNPDVFIYSGEYYPVGGEFFTSVCPKKYKVEKQTTSPHVENVLRRLGYGDLGHANAYVQQINGLKKVWELKEEYENDVGINYDLVIRTRPDFIMLQPVTPEIMEPGKICTLHYLGAPTICTEFAIGPDAEMEKYCKIWDWLWTTPSEMDPKNNPRCRTSMYAKHNSDTIMTVYLSDHHKMEMGEPNYTPGFPSCYDYYRIMTRHKKGEY